MQRAEAKGVGGILAAVLAVFGMLMPAANAAGLPGNASIPMGGRGGFAAAQCAPGFALGGLQYYSAGHGFIDAIVPMCVDYRAGDTTRELLSPMLVPGFGDFPGSNGNLDTAQCDNAAVTAIRGMVESQSRRVTGFSLLCRDAAGAITATPFKGRKFAAGGSGELLAETAISCGPGKIATGAYAYGESYRNGGEQASHARHWITGLGLLCDPLSLVVQSTAAKFAGDWLITVSDGSTFAMKLIASGGGIAGVYDTANRNGTISDGAAVGSRLSFKWVTAGSIKAAGTGSFHLDAPDRISGTWVTGPFTGTWSGVRQ